LRLLEYESKEIYKEYDVPLLDSVIIKKGEPIEQKVEEFPFPAIVKSQIAIGSRKKAGLIKIAQNPQEGIDLCKEFFNKEVAGFHVEAILLEELANIEHEYYCSIALEASAREFYLLVSAEGGIEIEEVAAKNPDAIFRKSFTLENGLSREMAEDLAKKLGFEHSNLNSAINLFLKLWKIAKDKEALLVEINPLVLTPSGLIAVDAKMEIDDNAIYRHDSFKELQQKKETEFEKFAKENNLFFVKLDGDVGVIGNGAGLTLELVDILSEMGIKPANFLDLGGGASPERVYKALKLILDLNPKAVIINIFGGITRCDYIAKGIIQAINSFDSTPPLVIRLIGTNYLEGIKLLKEKELNAYTNLMDAVDEVKNYLNLKVEV